jgi:tetratricopeptide (TPR) repeat protein
MKRVTAIVCVVLALAASASGYLSYRLEQMRGEATLEETALIATPKMARYASLGHTGLAADIYWTRAVQYFGGKHRARSRRYQLLEPLLNLTTDLDPQLLIAYYFGAFFLSQKPPEGAGDPDAAVRLVERGIKANPDEWRLYYHLGMIHYMERKDYTSAADAFERGAQNPKALSWMKVMAAAMRQRSGDIQTARYLWTQILRSTEDKMIQDNARNHLASLDVDEDILHLDELVAQYKSKNGEYPQSWADMVAAGLVRGVPADPTGTAYVLKGDHVEVRDATPFPFLERGRPPGQSVFDPVQ